MLRHIFKDELRNFKSEKSIMSGIKRIDILATNKSKSGFFHTLKESHQIRCPWIVIECKNYSHDLKNPEFDQIGGRLGKKIGNFGILAYRKYSKKNTIITRCIEYTNNIEENSIIFRLCDKDFRQLLLLKMKNNKYGIEDYLDNILQEIKIS